MQKSISLRSKNPRSSSNRFILNETFIFPSVPVLPNKNGKCIFITSAFFGWGFGRVWEVLIYRYVQEVQSDISRHVISGGNVWYLGGLLVIGFIRWKRSTWNFSYLEITIYIYIYFFFFSDELLLIISAKKKKKRIVVDHIICFIWKFWRRIKKWIWIKQKLTYLSSKLNLNKICRPELRKVVATPNISILQFSMYVSIWLSHKSICISFFPCTMETQRIKINKMKEYEKN